MAQPELNMHVSNVLVFVEYNMYISENKLNLDVCNEINKDERLNDLRFL